MIGTRFVGRLLVGVALVALVGCSSSSSSSSSTSTTAGTPSGPVRGFDGTTIRVASLGIKGQLPSVEVGARGRIKRFNDTNELKGVKIEYVEFADDKLDPTTALNEARRLVTEQKVFAIVGDASANNPGQYLAQQHVPYFGYGFDNTYCSDKPNPAIWAFSFIGCLVPADPKVLPDSVTPMYDYVAKQTGKQHPSIATIATDIDSGHKDVAHGNLELTSVGFSTPKVVYLTPPPVSDYTPYIQNLMHSDDGHAPDVIQCRVVTDCIPMWDKLQAAGFKGMYFHTLYSDLLLKAMKGSIVGIGWANMSDPTPARDQMKADVAAVKPDQGLDIGIAAGYFGADMFIAALKTAAAGGVSKITPESVQAAAARMTYEIKGLVGPTRYPSSTVVPTPTCSSYMLDDGTTWKTVVPFTCTSNTFAVK